MGALICGRYPPPAAEALEPREWDDRPRREHGPVSIKTLHGWKWSLEGDEPDDWTLLDTAGRCAAIVRAEGSGLSDGFPSQARIPPREPIELAKARAETMTGTSELIDVLRQRADQLAVPRLEIDRVAGLQNGYSAKVLSVTSGKRLGLRAMEALIPTLGLTMVAVKIPARCGNSPSEWISGNCRAMLTLA